MDPLDKTAAIVRTPAGEGRAHREEEVEGSHLREPSARSYWAGIGPPCGWSEKNKMSANPSGPNLRLSPTSPGSTWQEAPPVAGDGGHP